MAKEVSLLHCPHCVKMRGKSVFDGWTAGILDYIYGCWWICRTCGRGYEG